MKSNLTEESELCRLEIRASERASFTEYHLTVTIEGPADTAAAAAQAYRLVASTLLERKIQPLQEKVYGRIGVRDQVLALRDVAYRHHGLDRTMPATWLQGLPLQGCDFVGLQIWGVTCSKGESCVETVETPAHGRGRLWRADGFRMLHLAAVTGTNPDGRLAADHCAQAERVFTNIGLGLEAHGFRYPQVARTWIYNGRLLDWYDDLNRIRTAHFRRVGIGGPAGAPFPASTGIQCRSGEEECIVDVLAVEPGRPGAILVEPIRSSPRQDQSFNYGSAFSRGMTLTVEGKRTIHISGTASINPAGASTHLGDAECQSLETLMSIAAILEQQGGSLSSITSATLFCKNQEAFEAWCRVSRLLQIPFFPKVAVLADVCRDNLLVEMEAVAEI
jgi:enamine deaminase RidA (YjgF/YER057c/UK114 family)